MGSFAALSHIVCHFSCNFLYFCPQCWALRHQLCRSHSLHPAKMPHKCRNLGTKICLGCSSCPACCCSQTRGHGGWRGSGQEVAGHSVAEGSAHVKGTGKFFELCAKGNQESQSPPECFTSSEMGTGSFYWQWPVQPLGAKLGVWPHLERWGGICLTLYMFFCPVLELWSSLSKYIAKGSFLPLLTWPDGAPGALHRHQLAAVLYGKTAEIFSPTSSMTTLFLCSAV